MPRVAGVSYVEALLPEGFKRLDSFAGNFSYEFPYRPNVLADLFEELTERASEHGIVDWGISQTTYARARARDAANAAAA